MTNNEKKYGRTFFDLISEYPKHSFFIFLLLLLLSVSMIIFRVPFKVGGVEVGNNYSQIIQDTITKVKTDTLFVTKNPNTNNSQKEFSQNEKSKKISVKNSDTVISVFEQPANINTGTNNGIIGNNNIVNQAPMPTLKLIKIACQDQKSFENLTNLNKNLTGYEGVECYKTEIIFNYNSDSKKDYIDFKMNINNILHLKMNKLNEMFEIDTWVYQNKIKGIRFFNPTNGFYEMTVYTSTPIVDIWKYFEFDVNNKELPLTFK